MDSRCCLGTRQSVAPVSTRKSPSHTRPGSAGFRMDTVTWVAPIAQPLSKETSLLNYTIPSSLAISMATRQTHHRLSAEAGIHPRAAAVSSVLPVAQSTPRPPLLGFRLVGRNDGCGGGRQLGSAQSHQSTPALPPGFRLWAGMTDVEANLVPSGSHKPTLAGNEAPSFLRRQESIPYRCRQLGSAGRAVDPRPPSWIPARGPE